MGRVRGKGASHVLLFWRRLRAHGIFKFFCPRATYAEKRSAQNLHQKKNQCLTPVTLGSMCTRWHTLAPHVGQPRGLGGGGVGTRPWWLA